jgi:hypothetical protein
MIGKEENESSLIETACLRMRAENTRRNMSEFVKFLRVKSIMP